MDSVRKDVVHASAGTGGAVPDGLTSWYRPPYVPESICMGTPVQLKPIHGLGHRWVLPGNYPVFTVAMVIYHPVERIWRVLVTPIIFYNIYDHE